MKLGETLLRLGAALDAADCRYALVGGLATSARGEVRFTRDIDVAVSVATDEEAEQLLFALQSAGYTVVTTVEQDRVVCLATARMQSPGGLTCDLIFATSGIEAEIVASSEPLEVFPGTAIPVA